AGAGAGGLSGGTSSDFSVAPGPATQLAFTVQPVTTTAGHQIAPAVQLSALDALGNVVPGFTGDVTVALGGTNPSGGTLTGTTSVAAANGVAIFYALSLDKSGTAYTLTATASGLSAATSAPFDITPGAATHLTFTVQPGTTAAGNQIVPAVQAAALDALGNVVPSFTGSVTVALGSNPAGSTLSGSATVSAVSGVATFGDLSINTSGSGYTLTATATGLTGATSTPFGITPGAATHLVFTVQPA